MIKKGILLAALLFTAVVSFGQTVAPDFTANDCSGNPHNLYTELNAGNIIVMSWVMPCGGCTTQSQAADSVVSSYSVSNPGRVFFYLVDDLGDTDCASLSTWAGINSIHATKFSDSTISMSGYGSPGMPKIVVLGGSGHTVYYNVNSLTDGAGIANAIDAAIAATAEINESINASLYLKLYPNPISSHDIITVSFITDSKETSIEIYNALGASVQLIKVENYYSGQQQLKVNTIKFSNGIYYLKLKTGKLEQITKFSILR